jgi:hypothetical protein
MAAASIIGSRSAVCHGVNNMIVLQLTVLVLGISMFILGMLVLED